MSAEPRRGAAPVEAARRIAAAAPPLTPQQRLRLAVLMRPDLPVGIKPARKAAGA